LKARALLSLILKIKKAFIYNITALKKAKQIFSNLETLQRVHKTINQKVVKIKEIF
jgi:hypothetical protein